MTDQENRQMTHFLMTADKQKDRRWVLDNYEVRWFTTGCIHISDFGKSFTAANSFCMTLPLTANARIYKVERCEAVTVNSQGKK